jgi:bacterioferritin-associated ferredoxin
MIVCICRAVSDRKVRLAVLGGARSLREVGAACGAGRGCGSCHEEIAGIIAAESPLAATDCAMPELRVASAAAR